MSEHQTESTSPPSTEPTPEPTPDSITNLVMKRIANLEKLLPLPPALEKLPARLTVLLKEVDKINERVEAIETTLEHQAEHYNNLEQRMSEMATFANKLRRDLNDSTGRPAVHCKSCKRIVKNPSVAKCGICGNAWRSR